LQRSIGLSNSETVKEYMGYLSNAYVFYEMRQYHDSLKKQLHNPRKVYLNDPAFHNLVGFSNSQNLGRKLENSVYLALRRKSAELYSFRGKGECDFIRFDNQRRASAIQVCYTLNSDNETRELDGLLEAMKVLDFSEGLILTFDQDIELQKGGRSIKALPVWKWLLTG
jgi:uncharacterized protein